MSFFDEADEPPTAASPRRPGAHRRRPPGGGEPVQARRGIALAALLVLLVLIVLGIKSCQNSARDSALRTYSENVASLIQQSNGTGRNLFSLLTAGGGSGGAARLQTQIDQARVDADGQLARANGLGTPDEMRAAQQNLVLALRMRRDALADIATNIQPALGTSTNRDALAAIAADMARFYASDVIYKDYALPRIAAALHAAAIPVGGQSGESLDGDQFLPDIGWLAPAFIAGRLGAQSPVAAGKPAPGLHGHSLDSVSVAGTTLQTGSTNTLPASPPPTFTVSFTNGGTNTETNVAIKVTVNGASAQGRTVVPQTTPGQHATAQVTLDAAPPPGTYTVTVTVQPVPGEKDTTNNTQSYPVTFG